jgi:hypothetical protein
VRLDAIGIAWVHSRHPKFCLALAWAGSGAQPYWSGAYGVPTRYREVVLTVSKRLCLKSHNGALLCATSVFSVSLWLMNSWQKHTTETQRTQRLHREISAPRLLRQTLSKQSHSLRIYQSYDFASESDVQLGHSQYHLAVAGGYAVGCVHSLTTVNRRSS